jgi:hypothetical protein
MILWIIENWNWLHFQQILYIFIRYSNIHTIHSVWNFIWSEWELNWNLSSYKKIEFFQKLFELTFQRYYEFGPIVKKQIEEVLKFCKNIRAFCSRSGKMNSYLANDWAKNLFNSPVLVFNRNLCFSWISTRVIRIKNSIRQLIRKLRDVKWLVGQVLHHPFINISVVTLNISSKGLQRE